MRYLLLLGSLLLTATPAWPHHDIWHELFEKKMHDAERGDSDAQYDIGSMYQNGRGVAASRATAIEWYRKSAAQSNARAVSRLRLMEANEARFNKTVALSQDGDPESLFDTGHMYSKGIGTEIDPGRAIAAYQKSAGMGHAKSAYRLGLLYYEGSGVAQDYPTAFRWFTAAAQSGLPEAQYYLGKLYADGHGTGRDTRLALDWLSKAVDSGFDQARGEKINIMELIAEESAPPPVVRSAPATAQAVKANTAPAPAARKKQPAPPVKHYKHADLMAGAWTRDREPVDYLPSSINKCRTEQEQLVCFSYQLNRQTATHDIRYKTKSIIGKISSKGKFSVNYRHLVIDATALAETADDGSEGNSVGTYTIKTGWGNPHTLECEFSNSGELSCLKNNTHAFAVRKTTAMASGN